jgi:hypothetical protein
MLSMQTLVDILDILLTTCIIVVVIALGMIYYACSINEGLWSWIKIFTISGVLGIIFGITKEAIIKRIDLIKERKLQ